MDKILIVFKMVNLNKRFELCKENRYKIGKNLALCYSMCYIL